MSTDEKDLGHAAGLLRRADAEVQHARQFDDDGARISDVRRLASLTRARILIARADEQLAAAQRAMVD